MIDLPSVDHFSDLPQRLSALLERKGMTQRQLHDRSGVSISRINEYVKGKGGPPTLPILNRLLDALEATRDELFSETKGAVAQDSARMSLEERMAGLEEQHSFLEAEFGRLKLAIEHSLKSIAQRPGRKDGSRNGNAAG
ncbi:MAG: helix-turn-helix transcriptional regulator [bacterium]|nr:helix-turn-helix transcriptional regulator [bacterium]